MTRTSRRVTVMVALGLSVALANSAAAAPFEPSGAWSGVVAESSASWPATASKIELRLEPSGNLVSVKLTGPDGPLLNGEFQAVARDGVHESPTPSGLMALILRTKQVNPLEGQAMVWARRTGPSLIVYRLDVNGGPYRLDRMVLTASGNRLDLAFERRDHDRAPARFTARLERQAR